MNAAEKEVLEAAHEFMRMNAWPYVLGELGRCIACCAEPKNGSPDAGHYESCTWAKLKAALLKSGRNLREVHYDRRPQTDETGP